MSDLISRKETLSLLTNLQLNGGDLADAKRFVAVMPTAYDPDKVVEQLEKEKGIAFVTLANTGNKELDFTYQNVVAYMDKAIEIVKKGGAV